MPDWVFWSLFVVGFFGTMIGLTRYQTQKHQKNVNRSNDNLETLIAEQRATLAATERQAQALERIATALENRKP